MDGANVNSTGKKKKRLKRGKSSSSFSEELSNETAGKLLSDAHLTLSVTSKQNKPEQDEETELQTNRDERIPEQESSSSQTTIAELHNLEAFDSSIALSPHELAGLGILNTLHDLPQEETTPAVTFIQEPPAIRGSFDLYRQDEDGDTILHLAVVHEDESLSGFLVSRMKPRLDIYNDLRQTPLHLAVITKNINLIKLLLVSGADVNKPDRNGQTSTHLAVKTQELLYPQTILDTLHSTKAEVEPVDLEIRNYDGLTSLHLATMTGDCEIIGHLLAHGANIEAKDSKSGRTCLHHAVERNDQNVVEYLLKHGANVNAKTYAGNIPLHTASGRNMEGVYRLLLTYGSDIDLRNIEGDSARTVRKQSSVKTKQQKKGKASKKKTT